MQTLLQALRWLTRVETQDPDLERRGRITISLLCCFMALALLSAPILLALVEEGRFVILAMDVGFFLVIAAIVAVIRRGHVDIGGALSSIGMSAILSLGVLAGSADAFEEVGWFFAVSILIASYAVRPQLIIWITVLNILLLAGLGYFSYITHATDPGNMISMQILVVMLAVSSYLYSSQTLRMFQRLYTLNRELDQARGEAIGASEAKTKFLANMSHELRTPLNAILGYTELLQEELEDGTELDTDQALQDLSQVHRAGHHLLDLINDVLNLSRVLSGRSDLNLTPFSLKRLLDEIIPIMRPMALESGNDLQLSFDAEDLQLYTDERKVRQILLNLLSNAIKFTQDGKIDIRVTNPATNMVRVEVEDTGIGIAPELQDRLFRAFERVAEEHPTVGGTGLGLVLSREFAQLLGGDISFVSVHGEGSTFRFEFAVRMTAEELVNASDVSGETTYLVASSGA